MLENISQAAPDPILGLTEAFKSDSHPDKINLSVGVYKDEHGTTPILNCVRQAEGRLMESETTKSYLGIDGFSGFQQHVKCLLFGEDHKIVTQSRAATVQTPGGTAALRVAADFIKQQLSSARIWLSQPTWANHPNVFHAAGVETGSYPYFDAKANRMDVDAMIGALSEVPEGDVVLLHACCHNPTGVDPTMDQWRRIAAVIVERGLLPLIDFAYQGFGAGLTEDAAGLRTLAESVPEFIVCSSFSKNFGLYRERVGALTVVTSQTKATEPCFSQVKRCVRANYSNPPAHGAAIVNVVLSDSHLSEMWQQELTEMRDRIQKMREVFVKTIKLKGADRDFSFIQEQRGMFSFSGLTAEQVDALRDQYSIYIVRSGRINVAGMTTENMDRLCEAMVAVLDS